MRRILALVTSVVAVVLGVSFLIGYSPPANATPDVTWSQPSVSATFQPGQPTTTVVTLTAGDELAPAAVRITPSLAPYVSVSPMTTGILRRGQTQQFTLTFAAPADALPTTTQGTIQLRTGAVDAKPLPVAISVVWPQATNLPSGVTFAYPTFGQPSQIAAEAGTDGSLRVVVLTTKLTPPLMQYVIGFTPNPTHLSLLQWFAQHVDLSGSILAGGGYQPITLSNGVQVLVLTGEIPTAHLYCCGPIDGIYAITPSGATIMTVSTGQEHSFGDIDSSPDALRQMYLAMLASVTAP